MGRAIDRLTRSIVDAFDDVGLAPRSQVRENRIGARDFTQGGFKRAKVNGRPFRNIFETTRPRESHDPIKSSNAY